MRNKLLLCCLLSFSFLSLHAQNKSLSVGIKVVNEIDLEDGTLYPGVGGQIVYRMNKHSGLESGLYYSNQTMSYYAYINGFGNYSIEIAEHWLTLPLLYRFDSRFINFTAGPQIDYFLGWNNKHKEPSVIINSYSRPSARVALSGALSKTIQLSKSWLIEPEARLLFYPSEEYATLGLNIALRKKLF